MNNPRPTRLPILVIVVALFVAFAPLMSAEFVRWDDPDTVAVNPHLNPPTIKGLIHHWTHPHMDLYVPVTYTFWAAVAAVSRTTVPDPETGVWLNPMIFHGANLALHTLATLVVWRLLLLLSSRPWAAVIGALLFGLHPVQVEPVGWVSGGKDVLAGLFSLVAVWQYVLYAGEAGPRRRVRYGVALGAYVLAVLAKPAAVTTPVAIAAVDLWILRRAWKDVLRALWPWLVVAVPVVVVTKLAQPSPGTYTAPLWARPVIALDALAAYAGKLVWPARLAIDYGRSPEWLLGSSQRFWTWVVPVVVAVAAWIVRRPTGWLLAGLAVVVAFLLPVLGLVKFDFQRHSTVADHYLYTAMAGVAIIATFALARVPDRWTYAAAMVVLVLLGVRTFAQTWVWQDSRSLFANAVRVNPTSLAGHSGLADVAQQDGRRADALYHFRAAVDAHPRDAIANYHLGNALLLAGRPIDAVGPYRIGIAGGRDYPFMFVNLATALYRSGNLAQATEICEQGLDRWPDSGELRATYGFLLAARGDWQGAAEEYETALRIDPGLSAAREGLEMARRRATSQPATAPSTRR